MSVGMSGFLCYTVVMPELPDLEFIKEFLQDHIVGQEIKERILFPFCRLSSESVVVLLRG